MGSNIKVVIGDFLICLAAGAMMNISLNFRFLTISSLVYARITFIKNFLVPSISVFKLIHVCTGKTFFMPTSSASATLEGLHFLTLTSRRRHQIGLYVDSLLRWNQKMNLTAVGVENAAMERHVEDSLAMVKLICSSYISCCGSYFHDLSVVDVGSGAGLPGINLAIECHSDAFRAHEHALCLLRTSTSSSKHIPASCGVNLACAFLEHVVAKCASYKGRS